MIKRFYDCGCEYTFDGAVAIGFAFCAKHLRGIEWNGQETKVSEIDGIHDRLKKLEERYCHHTHTCPEPPRLSEIEGIHDRLKKLEDVINYHFNLHMDNCTTLENRVKKLEDSQNDRPKDHDIYTTTLGNRVKKLEEFCGIPIDTTRSENDKELDVRVSNLEEWKEAWYHDHHGQMRDIKELKEWKKKHHEKWGTDELK